ncbi:hypothetical protein ALC56_07516 [Trachymyrmex septentrionalis]|uniref:Endonuclease/exonuclease/phosphatase domain-containing protein n=1 Tax=Trachymyrmex septentrionalis TaxID=34720 RepID=A0A195FCJ5_9HYME|nr:hypothetical protein ALC56_07516 [Trachymyrmex septentrionalis]
MEKLKEENADLKKRVEEIEKRRDDQERRDRRLNVVMRGVEVEGGNMKDAAVGVLKKLGGLDKEIKIREVYKIGNRMNDRMNDRTNESVLLVKLNSLDDKKEIMIRRNKLTGTKIYVDDDLTKDERERQKEIRFWAKREKERGRRVKVGFGKAWMNGKEYVWSEERKKGGKQKGKATEEGEKRSIKGVFWNIAGLKRKDEDFWDFLKDFDVIGLSETWVEEAGWGKIKEKMPDGWRWKCQPARREKKRGRAMGGIITGIRKEIEERSRSEEEVEGIQQREVVVDEERWRIVTVYNKEGSKEELDRLKEMIGEREEENMIIVGDFNARIGKEGGFCDQNGEEKGENGKERRSKDGVVNKQGCELVKVVGERGWLILNGWKKGDEEGEWTYEKAGGKSVIDYGIVNLEAEEKIRCFEIGCRAESDHQPILIELGKEYTRQEKEKESEAEMIQDWSEEGIEIFRKNIEEVEWEKGEGGGRWEEMEEVMKRAPKMKRKGGRKEVGWVPWWDRECREKKREVNRAGRRYRRRKVAMGWVWSYGERKFKGDVRWRLKLFDSIVKGILLYGVEIWGYKEWKEIEALQEKYLRWILGVKSCTPGYIVREELKRNKMRVETGWRAGRFEERIQKGEGGEIGRESIVERRKEEREKRKEEWTRESLERREYLWRGGVSEEALNEWGEGKWERLRERDIEVDMQQRGEEVRTSRSCKNYRNVIGIPEYIRKSKKREGKKMQMIARWRCGNEERGNMFWMNEEERKCRVCEKEREDIKHMKEECVLLKKERWNRIEVLHEDGRGYEWMQMIEAARKKREEERERERERVSETDMSE